MRNYKNHNHSYAVLMIKRKYALFLVIMVNFP